MIDYITIIILTLSVVLGLLIMNVGFLGLQHDKLFNDIQDVINITENENIVDRTSSDNQTRMIIINVTGTTTNSTQAILKNITTLMNQQFEVLDAKIDRLEGVEARIHNNVQQLLERDNERNNETSRIIPILPDFR